MDDYVEKARKYATEFLRKGFNSYIGERKSDECCRELENTIKDNISVMIDHLPKILPLHIPMVPCSCLPPNCVAAIKTDESGDYVFCVDLDKETGTFQVRFDLDVYQFAEASGEKEG